MDQMLFDGLTPSIEIYNTILEVIFKKGNFCEILSLFDAIVMEGCERIEATCKILRRRTPKSRMK